MAVYGAKYDMVIAGIYLDSFFDAREDAHKNARFSAHTLAFNSAKRFLQSVNKMDAHTLKAVSLGCFKNGLAGHLLRVTPRKAFGLPR